MGILMGLENENEEEIEKKYNSGQGKLYKEHKKGTQGEQNNVLSHLVSVKIQHKNKESNNKHNSSQ